MPAPASATHRTKRTLARLRCWAQGHGPMTHEVRELPVVTDEAILDDDRRAQARTEENCAAAADD